MDMDPYEILDVKVTATQAEIKKAYRTLSKEHHPDKYKSKKMKKKKTDMFAVIAEAYDILSDPEKRKMYDETGDVKEGPTLKQRATELMGQIMMNVVNNENMTVDTVYPMILAEIENSLNQLPQQIADNVRHIERLNQVLTLKCGTNPKRAILANFISASIGAVTERNVYLETEKEVHALCKEMIVENYFDETGEHLQRHELTDDFANTWKNFNNGFNLGTTT